MSGVTASARGRFVCAEYDSWDAYQGKRGPVSAGSSFRIHVLTGADDDAQLVSIWTAQDDIHRAREACAGLKFGEQCEFIVQPGAQRSYRFIDRPVLAKSA